MKTKNITLIASTLLCTSGMSQVKTSAPNVVFILVDDLGWTDVGVYGSDFHRTPNIDALAGQGTMFTNAYSSCTVSSPTRASIMTGKYPARLHLTDWIEGYNFPNAKLKIPSWTMYLPQEEATMAEVFKEAGYATGHFGKWHLGEDEKYWPEHQGFDINVGGWAKGAPNLDKQKGFSGYFPPYGNPRLSNGNKNEYLTERLAKEACTFIEANRNKPFFANVWLYNVHTPLQARKEKIDYYLARVDSAKHQHNAVYAAMVEHVDDAVGQIVKTLKRLNIYDNTIIVFTSDNGGLIGTTFNMRIANNFPLRSGKGDMYEGGVRVPLLIKNAKTQPQEKQNDTPVIAVDFLPTLADLANIPLQKSLSASIDGISLKPMLTDNATQPERKSIFWHYPHYHTEGATPYSAIRRGNWKLIHIMENDTYELYNLKNDVGEKNNVIAREAEIAKSMTKELEQWRKSVNAQMPTANPGWSKTRERNVAEAKYNFLNE